MFMYLKFNAEIIYECKHFVSLPFQKDNKRHFLYLFVLSLNFIKLEIGKIILRVFIQYDYVFFTVTNKSNIDCSNKNENFLINTKWIIG